MSRSGGSRSLTPRPPMRISPLVIPSSPATMRSAVVFPQPEGPTKIMNSPSSTTRLMSSTATVPSGNRLETPTNSIDAISPPVRLDRPWPRRNHVLREGECTIAARCGVSGPEDALLFAPLTDVFGDDVVLEHFSERSLVSVWLEGARALDAAQVECGVIPEAAAAAIDAAARPEAIDLQL